MIVKAVTVAAIFASVTTPAWAEGADDAIRGSAVAQMMCKSCHSIEPEGVSTNPAAPPFRSMNMAFKSGAEFAEFLNVRHPAISGPLLTEHRANDLVAFIATLKPPHPN